MGTVLDQIKWVQNPLQGMEQATARGIQLGMERERLDMQKRQQEQLMREEAEKQKIIESQMSVARRMRTMKHMDKGLELVEQSFQQDPSGNAAKKIMQRYQDVMRQSPDQFDPEIMQSVENIQLAPVGMQLPEGVDLAPHMLTPEQIPDFRMQLQTGLEALGMPVTQEQELNMAKLQADVATRQAKLGQEQIDFFRQRQAVEADSIGNMLTSVGAIEKAALEGRPLTGDLVGPLFQEMQQMRQLGILGPQGFQERMGQIVQGLQSPEGIQQLKEQLAQRQAAVTNSDEFTEEQLGAAAMAAEKMGQPGLQTDLGQWMGLDPDVRNQYIQDYRQAKIAEEERRSKLRVKERRAGRTVVQVGRDEPTTSRRGQEQTRLSDARQTMEFIDDIKALGDPGQFLGFMRRAEYWISDVRRQAKDVPPLSALLGDLSPAERAQYEKASEFRGIVKRYRALELKRLIGSAQTATEIKNLAGSLLDVNMSDLEFQVALERLERETRRVEAAASEAISKGYKVGTKDHVNYMELQLEAQMILRKVRAGKMKKSVGQRKLARLKKKYGHLAER